MLKSVIWSSMLDYPGHVCTTLFFDGCNFACEYCQNKDINKAQAIDFETEILPQLIERKPMIKHIVLSGGECTIDPQIQKVVDTLVKNGFAVGLHTNGYNYEFLAKNIHQISYIGMDVKTSFEKYNQIAARKVDIDQIKKSIDLIINQLNQYEFRTTVYPKSVDEKDCLKIAKYLGERKAKQYTLQQYKRIEGIAVIPFSREKMEEIYRKCNVYVQTGLRGLIK